MSNLVQVKFGPRPPSDSVAILRELADATERGEVTAIVMAYVRDGQYMVSHGASLTDGLVLSTLLHQSALSKFQA